MLKPPENTAARKVRVGSIDAGTPIMMYTSRWNINDLLMPPGLDAQTAEKNTIKTISKWGVFFSGITALWYPQSAGSRARTIFALWTCFVYAALLSFIVLVGINEGFLDSVTYIGISISHLLFQLFSRKHMKYVFGIPDRKMETELPKRFRSSTLILVFMSIVLPSALIFVRGFGYFVAFLPIIVLSGGGFFAFVILTCTALRRQIRQVLDVALSVIAAHNEEAAAENGSNDIQLSVQESHEAEGSSVNVPDQEGYKWSLYDVATAHSRVAKLIWYASQHMSHAVVPCTIGLTLAGILLVVLGLYEPVASARMSLVTFGGAIMFMPFIILVPLATVTHVLQQVTSKINLLVSATRLGIADGSRSALLHQINAFTAGFTLYGMPVAFSFLLKIFYLLFSAAVVASRFFIF